MTEVHLLQFALAIAIAGVGLLWVLPNSKCVCVKCAFHENERRMAALRQKEHDHDVEHKGFGFRDITPDRFNCDDADCPRNARPR